MLEFQLSEPAARLVGRWPDFDITLAFVSAACCQFNLPIERAGALALDLGFNFNFEG